MKLTITTERKPILTKKNTKVEKTEKEEPKISKKRRYNTTFGKTKIVVTKIKPPKKSKYYSQKDVIIAKKAIKLMEQSKYMML